MELCYQLKSVLPTFWTLQRITAFMRGASLQKICLIWVCLVYLLSPRLLVAESWTDWHNSGWEARPIAPSMVKVVDGDTFYVDWNRNKYTKSEEKIPYCLLILQSCILPTRGRIYNLVCRLGIFSKIDCKTGPCNSGCLLDSQEIAISGL